jgi:hypothetical protein
MHLDQWEAARLAMWELKREGSLVRFPCRVRFDPSGFIGSGKNKWIIFFDNGPDVDPGEYFIIVDDETGETFVPHQF